MTEREWHPGDGAEQRDSSFDAAQERLATGHWTAGHLSEESLDGFDSAYLSWRDLNGSGLDNDYKRWRRDTGQPFSKAFLQWARARPQ